MGKYVVVVVIVILTAILAGFFPYAQSNNGNEQSLIVVLDTFYSVDLGEKEVAICYLGGSTFFLRTQNHVILIDPGDKINLKGVHGIKKLDALLFSRESITHHDLEIIQSIHQRTNSTIITNQLVYDGLKGYIPPEKLRKVPSKETFSISNITIIAISSNEEGDGWLTFVISVDGVKIFHGSSLNFTENEASRIFSELRDYVKTVDVAIIPAERGSAGSFRNPLKIVSVLKPQIVVTMRGSLEEQNTLKGLIEKEYSSISVLMPERLWVYELVAE